MIIGFQGAPALVAPADGPANAFWAVGPTAAGYPGYYAHYIIDGVGAPDATVYSQLPLSRRGGAFLVSLTTGLGGEQAAVCAAQGQGKACYAVPLDAGMAPALTLLTAPTPSGDGEPTAVIADGTTGYLWRGFPEPFEASCCTPDYVETGCAMASLTACVCGLDPYCCNVTWDDDCVLDVAACGGGCP
jgi:hypothetical protein